MGNTHRLPGHWTDDQLLEHLYGVGPEDRNGNRHLEDCRECQSRLLNMRAHRESLERHSPPEETVNHGFLMAQRRAIYAKLTQQNSWYPASWSTLGEWLSGGRRLTSAAAALLVLSGSVFLYEQRHQERIVPVEHVSDIELAQAVSQMAQDSEAEPTAPLQALFD